MLAIVDSWAAEDPQAAALLSLDARGDIVQLDTAARAVPMPGPNLLTAAANCAIRSAASRPTAIWERLGGRSRRRLVDLRPERSPTMHLWLAAASTDHDENGAPGRPPARQRPERVQWTAYTLSSVWRW